MLVPRVSAGVRMVLKRNIGMTAALQHPAMDHIQELFLNKVREFKKGGAKMDDVPALAKERKDNLERVAKQYNVTASSDMTKFPEFRFTDPQVDMESMKK